MIPRYALSELSQKILHLIFPLVLVHVVYQVLSLDQAHIYPSQIINSKN